MYGAITKSYTVWGSDSEVSEVPYSHDTYLELSEERKTAFIRVIRRAGWRQIQGVWYCPACVRKQKEMKKV